MEYPTLIQELLTKQIFFDDVVIDLPSLKTIYLDYIRFEDNYSVVFVNLISGFPKIKELVMKDIMWQTWEACFVTSTILKKLNIISDR